MSEAQSPLTELPFRFGKVTCPKCTSPLRLPPDSQGRKVKCPTCLFKWRNGSPTGTPSTDALQLAAPGAATPFATPPGVDLPISHSMLVPPAPPTLPPLKDETVNAKAASAGWLRKPPRGPEFEPIDCNVIVLDHATNIEDRCAGLIYCEGLLLLRPDQRQLLPVGTPANYEGDNACTLTLPDRKLTLRVSRLQTDMNRLVFDLCRFFNRQQESLDLEHYLKATWLYLLALLPLGLIPLSGFGPLFIGLAVVLSALCLLCTRLPQLPYLSKLIGCFGLAVLGYGVWAIIELPQMFAAPKPTPSLTQPAATGADS